MIKIKLVLSQSSFGLIFTTLLSHRIVIIAFICILPKGNLPRDSVMEPQTYGQNGAQRHHASQLPRVQTLSGL